jgi:hypothetical protein
MWQYADSSKGPRKDLYSTQAINKALKKVGHTSLAEQFAKYSAATRATHLTFKEGAALNYPSKPLAGAAALTRHKHKTFRTKLDHLTSASYQFVPGGGTSKLKVTVKMASKSKGSRAVFVVYGPGGILKSKAIKLNRHGVGHKKIVFDGSVTAVEVTLVDASTRYRDCYRRQTPYACQGVPVDDNLKAMVQAKAA